MPRGNLSFFDEKRPIHKARTSWGCWWQTVQEIHIQVDLPEGVRSKEIKVEVKPKYIHCAVQGRTVFQGTLPRTVYAEETLWTLEDGILCILLSKADYTVREEIWESLLENGVFRPDAWTLHGMRKDYDLEKFQMENPGMDFSRAKLAKNYDRLPGWSLQRLAELRRRSEGQPPKTQAASTQTLSDLSQNEERGENAQGQAPRAPAATTQTLAGVKKNGEGSANAQGQAPKASATAGQTLADVKKSGDGSAVVQGPAPKAPATQTLDDVKKNGEGSAKAQGQAPKASATAGHILSDLKKKTKEGGDKKQAPKTQAMGTPALSNLKKSGEESAKAQGRSPKASVTAAQTLSDLKKSGEGSAKAQRRAPKASATAAQTLSDLKKKCKERRDKEEQGPKTQPTGTETLADLKKKKTEESGDKVQE